MALKYLEQSLANGSMDPDAELLALIRKAPSSSSGHVSVPRRGWAALKDAARKSPRKGVRRRPTRFWPVVTAAALVIAFPLHVLALAAVFTFVECALIAWMLGYHRLSRMVIAQYRKIQSVDPCHAEVLRHRAIRIASALDWILSRVPERWTRGLYLPDFEPQEEPEIFALDPFARLEAEADLRRF